MENRNYIYIYTSDIIIVMYFNYITRRLCSTRRSLRYQTPAYFSARPFESEEKKKQKTAHKYYIPRDNCYLVCKMFLIKKKKKSLR